MVMALLYTIPIQSQGVIDFESTICKTTNSSYSAIIRNIKIQNIPSDLIFTLSLFRSKLKSIEQLYSFNLSEGDILIDSDKYLIMPGDYLFASSTVSGISYVIDGYETLLDNVSGTLQNL